MNMRRLGAWTRCLRRVACNTPWARGFADAAVADVTSGPHSLCLLEAGRDPSSKDLSDVRNFDPMIKVSGNSGKLSKLCLTIGGAQGRYRYPFRPLKCEEMPLATPAC